MHGFEASFRRHLRSEQRRAVLVAIASKLDDGATVGDVLDAAEELGWGERMGDLSLGELATALLRPEGPETPEDEADAGRATYTGAIEAASSEESDDFDDDDLDGLFVQAHRESVEDEPVVAEAVEEPKTTKKRSKKAAKKKAARKATKKASSSSGRSKPQRTQSSSKSSLRTLRRKIEADEPLSFDEAAELLLPIVGDLHPATMQALEDYTGVGRRKLRFHIGQLVRHGYLARHGMGRGTHYTVIA